MTLRPLRGLAPDLFRITRQSRAGRVAWAVCRVVVDQPRRLHEGIDNRWSTETEARFLKVF